MKTHKLNQALVLSLAVVSLLGTVACSSQSGTSNANYSLGTTSILTTGAGYNSAGQALAACSTNVNPPPDFSMSLENYTLNGSTYSNWIRIHFNAFPANFTNTAALITFWAYGTDSYGNYTSAIQVPFFVEKYNGVGSYTQISAQPVYSMSWSALATLATQNGLSAASGAAAVQGLDFVVELDNYPTATVIDASLYLSGAGNGSYYVAPDRFIAALIPTFLANPNDYAAQHPQSLLVLHPFYSLIASGYSEAQFETTASSLCF